MKRCSLCARWFPFVTPDSSFLPPPSPCCLLPCWGVTAHLLCWGLAAYLLCWELAAYLLCWVLTAYLLPCLGPGPPSSPPLEQSPLPLEPRQHPTSVSGTIIATAACSWKASVILSKSLPIFFSRFIAKFSAVRLFS